MAARSPASGGALPDADGITQKVAKIERRRRIHVQHERFTGNNLRSEQDALELACLSNPQGQILYKTYVSELASPHALDSLPAHLRSMAQALDVNRFAELNLQPRDDAMAARAVEEFFDQLEKLDQQATEANGKWYAMLLSEAKTSIVRHCRAQGKEDMNAADVPDKQAHLALVTKLKTQFLNTLMRVPGAAPGLGHELARSSGSFMDALVYVRDAMILTDLFEDDHILRVNMTYMITALADKILPFHEGADSGHYLRLGVLAEFAGFLWYYDHTFDGFSDRHQGHMIPAPYLRALNHAIKAAANAGLMSGAKFTTFSELLVQPPVSEAIAAACALAKEVAIARTLLEGLARGLPAVMGHVALQLVKMQLQAGQLVHFRKSVESHIDMRLVELAVREDTLVTAQHEPGSLSPYQTAVQAYDCLREDTGAVEPTLELILAFRAHERCIQDATLDELHRSPNFQVFNTAFRHANMHVCYVNDVVSGPREIREDDTNAFTARVRWLPEYGALVEYYRGELASRSTEMQETMQARILSVLHLLCNAPLPLTASRRVRYPKRDGVEISREIRVTLAHHVNAVVASVRTLKEAAGADVSELVGDVTLEWMIGNLIWSVENPRYSEGVPWFVALCCDNKLALQAIFQQAFVDFQSKLKLDH